MTNQICRSCNDVQNGKLQLARNYCRSSGFTFAAEVADSLGYCLKAEQVQAILSFVGGKVVFLSLRLNIVQESEHNNAYIM